MVTIAVYKGEMVGVYDTVAGTTDVKVGPTPQTSLKATEIVKEFPWLATFGDPPATVQSPLPLSASNAFSTAEQTLNLTVPNVHLHDGNGHTRNYEYHLRLTFNWEDGGAAGGPTGIDKLTDAKHGGLNPTHFLVDGAWADLIAANTVKAAATGQVFASPQLVDAGTACGMTISKIIIVSHISDEDKVEQRFFNALLKDTAHLKKQLLKAEMHLAISGKANEQWAANAERIAKVKTDYMWAMNAIGKASGGRDRASSRVAACCCCSVASKVSASIWGSGEVDVAANGGLSLDGDITLKGGGNIDLSRDGKIEGGGNIDEELEFFEPSSAPTASAPGNAVDAGTAGGGAPTNGKVIQFVGEITSRGKAPSSN